MKKRIISLVLVVVMLALSLVSCGYSFAKDDLSAYATFSDANKAAFEDALKKLLIEDGDFTAETEKRKNQVIENVYKALANGADQTNTKLEGVPGKYDLVKYCYYVTAEIEGVTHVFSASTMNTTSAVTLQLGLDYSDAVASAAVAAALGALDFKDKTYTVTSTTDVTANQGDVVYVSYKFSYEVTDDKGVKTEKTGTVTYEPIVVGAAAESGQQATSLASFLAGKKIGSSLGTATVNDTEKGEVKYSDIKINWRANGKEATSFKDVTYKAETKVKDVYGTEFDLNDKELTYHIYPVSYIPVDEYSANSIINVILAESITADYLYQFILGEDFAYLDEKEDKDKIEERAEILKNYKTADNKSLDAVATELAKLFDTINNEKTGTKKALADAKTAFHTAEHAYNEAKAAFENPETTDEAKLKELEDAYNKAKSTYETETKDLENAENLNKTKVEEKDKLVKALLEITVDNETVATKLERGYRIATYDYLQDNEESGYNYQIKMNLAKEVYYYLVTNETTRVEVTGVPKDAVELTYKQLIDNYKHSFYEEKTESNNTVSNYKQYNGSFQKFLIAKVTADIKAVKTYKDALAAVREEAAEYVKPLVAIYYAAEVYGLTVTDKEIKDYKKTDEYISASSYGENTAIHAYQFDKLMDYFLEYEEKEVEDGEYTKVIFEYKRVAYTIGEPASEKEETTEEE